MTEEKKTPENATSDSNEDKQGDPPKEKRSAVPYLTGITLLCCIVLFALHILADKYTPYTANGRIEAFVVPIVPLVSGPLTEVTVANNQHVEEGQVLAIIDSEKYELAVQSAMASLQQATQKSEADIAAVASAQAKVTESEANLQNAEVKGKRIIKLSKQGAASLSRADDARSRISASRAKLDRALSELDRAKSNLGKTGKENAQIQSAYAALESAQLDLQRSRITAPSNGIITNLMVDVGHYASTGAPVMTFIATKHVWVQADMRENCLLNIKVGNPVELVLDAAPGMVFKGEVLSIGYGVSDNSASNPGSLATVNPTQGWLRQAQHLPVLISFSDQEAKGYRRVGGQVNSIIYTGNRPLLNFFGRVWIRLISIMSHIY